MKIIDHFDHKVGITKNILGECFLFCKDCDKDIYFLKEDLK